MAEQGGYRKPNNPAPVSGPGRMSQRTDGQPSEDNMKQAKRYVSGGDYGDGQEMMEIQGGAPMAKAPGLSQADSPSIAREATPMRRRRLEEVPSIMAPSAKPSEPVTAGARVGAGPGEEVLPGTLDSGRAAVDREKLTVMYGLLEKAASRTNASQGVKEMARRVRSLL